MENLPRTTCEAMRRPSAWVKRFAPLFDPREEVLDLAAGEGRHTAWLLLTGHRVLAVDRDVSVLDPLVGTKNFTLECRDLEGEPWPYAPERFGAIVVTNYLHRPLFPHFWESLRPGGHFVTETFTRANRELWGRPSRSAHFLEEGELLHLTPEGARIIAFESGETSRGLAVERIVWQKPGPCMRLVEPLGAS